jgi:diguanylate cyclase (GGDEF)-like protein
MKRARAFGLEFSRAAAGAAGVNDGLESGRAGQGRLLPLPLVQPPAAEAGGLQPLVRQICSELGAAACALCALDGRDELVMVAGWAPRSTARLVEAFGPRVRVSHVPLLSRALREGRVLQAGEAEQVATATRRWLDSLGAGEATVVPLETAGAVIGCLVLLDATGFRLNADTARLLSALGAPAAAALHNARRLEEQEERNRQLDSLLESIRAMTSNSTLADVLEVVARQAAAALSVPSCAIFEFVRDEDCLILRADADPPPVGSGHDDLGARYDLSGFPHDRQVLDRGEVVQQRVSDEKLDAATRETMEEHGEKSCLSVPLAFKGQSVGLMEIIETRWERDFSAAERDLARGIGEQAAAAIVNARLYRDQELHAQRLASLLEVGRTISSSMAAPELLEQVARVSAEALDAQLCVVLEYDASAERLVLRAGHSRDGARDDAFWAGFTYDLDDFPGERTILEGRVPVVETLGDPGLEPASRASMEEWGEQTYLNVPLVFGGELVGMLQLVETEHEREYSPEELEFAAGIGEQAAVAVQNARRYRELREATDLLENQLQVRHSLLELSEALLTLRDREAVFEHITGVLTMLVTYESLEISFIDHQAGELVEVFQSETSVNTTLGLRLPLGEGVCGAVIASGQPEMVNDMLRDERAVQVPDTDEEEQASIIVPLQVGGAIFGVLSISRFEGRTFSDREFQLVQLVTNLTAIAIQNSRLYDELQDKAIRDGLTGLYNHRYFYERLAQEVARSQRYGTPLSLLMIDLDDFKRFNDRHGHLLGDEALMAVARSLLAEVRRDVDIVARYGGEEFAVLLPSTPCRDELSATACAGQEPGCPAATVAARIRSRVARELFGAGADGPPGGLTVSIGAATLPDAANDGHELIERADKALYLAKRLGKDRVQVFEP